MGKIVLKYPPPLSNSVLNEVTIRNAEIIDRFVDDVKDLVEGILLSGSNSYGGETQDSDIDLLIMVNDMDTIGSVINVCIDSNLLNIKEKKRFEIFKDLYNKNEAEQFSIVAHYLDVEVSIDFLQIDTIKRICQLKSIRESEYRDNIGEINIRTIREFRSNPPKNLGYTLNDLRGIRKIVYHPNFKEIKRDNNILGYLSETLVDGQSTVNGEPTYFIGVMSFFFSIVPIILLDTDEILSQMIKKFQSNIAKIMKGETPKYITRQERMSEEVLEKVKESLSIIQKVSFFVSQK